MCVWGGGGGSALNVPASKDFYPGNNINRSSDKDNWTETKLPSFTGGQCHSPSRKINFIQFRSRNVIKV